MQMQGSEKSKNVLIYNWIYLRHKPTKQYMQWRFWSSIQGPRLYFSLGFRNLCNCKRRLISSHWFVLVFICPENTWLALFSSKGRLLGYTSLLTCLTTGLLNCQYMPRIKEINVIPSNTLNSSASLALHHMGTVQGQPARVWTDGYGNKKRVRGNVGNK